MALITGELLHAYYSARIKNGLNLIKNGSFVRLKKELTANVKGFAEI